MTGQEWADFLRLVYAAFLGAIAWYLKGLHADVRALRDAIEGKGGVRETLASLNTDLVNVKQDVWQLQQGRTP